MLDQKPASIDLLSLLLRARQAISMGWKNVAMGALCRASFMSYHLAPDTIPTTGLANSNMSYVESLP
jgi:hypothetical protein